VIEKTAARSLSEWRNGGGLRLRLAQGGSTITQQLVRVYFLGYLTARLDDDAVFLRGLSLARVMSAVLGAPATNKLLRKLEEVRLSLWLEEAMRKQYGTREQAKREIFARYASFIYMGSGRYGFGAAAEYYFDKPLAASPPSTPAARLCLRDRQVTPRLRARRRQRALAAAPQPDPGPDGQERRHP
jgi:membrane peptidoglycan carboxypeptidase